MRKLDRARGYFQVARACYKVRLIQAFALFGVFLILKKTKSNEQAAANMGLEL
jgi:hypothetical protein